jgi:hypothetical protein
VIILIEGIDRTGKSTLADRLSAFTGGTIFHFSKPETHPLYEYTASLATYDPVRSTVILDRSHVGESVWPLVFDRPSKLDEPMRRWLNMFYMSRGAVLLHAVRAVDQATADEYEAAGEPIYLLGDIDYAANLYRSVVSETGLPVWEYEHGGWPGAALHEAARRSVIASELMGVTPRWVGSPAPRLLIVGPHDSHRAMPSMPYEDTDAHFLLGELSGWRQCALVNAVRPDGEGVEPLKALWRGLGSPAVVAIGGEAADTVRSCGMAPDDVIGDLHGWRRTTSGNLGEYLGRIV